MPQVGDKHYPYTKAGYKAAATAKKKMSHTDYRKGGLFHKNNNDKSNCTCNQCPEDCSCENCTPEMCECVRVPMEKAEEGWSV